MLSSDFLKKLDELQLYTKRSFLASKQGQHVSLKKGHGIEFADYRKYEPGDAPRYIDWKVYARSDRLYVKTFREEQNLHVSLLVDTSSSMINDQFYEKWEWIKSLILSLSYISLVQSEELSVYLLADRKASQEENSKNSQSGFGYRTLRGLKQFSMLDSFLDINAENSCSQKFFLKNIKHIVQRLRYPGIAILISDFMYPVDTFREYFQILRSRNLDLTALQVRSRADTSPLEEKQYAYIKDAETGERLYVGLDEEQRGAYEELLLNHTRQLRQCCSSFGIKFVEGSTDDDLLAFITESLSGIGLIR
jgi:uncharacterized protein (DUF58 family)